MVRSNLYGISSNLNRIKKFYILIKSDFQVANIREMINRSVLRQVLRPVHGEDAEGCVGRESAGKRRRGHSYYTGGSSSRASAYQRVSLQMDVDYRRKRLYKRLQQFGYEITTAGQPGGNETEVLKLLLLDRRGAQHLAESVLVYVGLSWGGVDVQETAQVLSLHR